MGAGQEGLKSDRGSSRVLVEPTRRSGNATLLPDLPKVTVTLERGSEALPVKIYTAIH